MRFPEHAPARATRRHRAARAAFALAILCIAPLAAVQAQVVIYRCTDARGEITLQNDVPCPKGSKQVKRVMEAPPPAAPYAPTPAPPPAPVAEIAPPPPAAPPRPPSPMDALPPPAIADADRLPPPALFECRTWDNDTYLDERGTPPPRCVTLSTTGLGGYVEGAGAACEMKTDSCQRIPDGALCDSWRRRLREAESVLRFGVSEDQDKARADLERIALVVRDSTCGL